MREEVLTKKPGDQVSGPECELPTTSGMALSASPLNFSPFHCLLRSSPPRPSHAADMKRSREGLLLLFLSGVRAMISQRRESLMVKFQASGEAVLGSRDQIPHRAVTLTPSLLGSHTLAPWPLAVVGKESVNVIDRCGPNVSPNC